MKKIAPLIYTVAFAFLLGGLCSCDNELNDPQVAIIGQWELIAEGPTEKKLTYHEPSEGFYQEFLDNGTVIISFAVGEQQFLLNNSYTIDNRQLHLYDKSGFEYKIYKYSFINRDKLKLIHVSGLIEDSMGTPRVFIYQRKK